MIALNEKSSDQVTILHEPWQFSCNDVNNFDLSYQNQDLSERNFQVPRFRLGAHEVFVKWAFGGL